MAEKKIQGSITLVTVKDGAAGQNGAPGISMYTYVRYADDDNGTNISEKPTKTSKYIAVLTTTSPTAPSTGYTWSKYVGEDGQNGKNGENGKDGEQGPQGIQGPPGKDGEDGTGVTILGSYASEEELRTAHPTGKIGEAYLVEGSLYVWSETENDWTNVGDIKGPQGEQGETGIGVKEIIEQYYLSTSNQNQTEGSWEETQDAWSPDRYIWTRSKIVWTDDKITYTSPILAESINAANMNANRAAADATTAKNTANSAKDTADSASSTASAAKDTADAASTTANEAKSNASVAVEQANVANATANEAKETATNASKGLSSLTEIVTNNYNELQNQIDGAISTWFYDYAPTLTNKPAEEWTTDKVKNQHLGDLFYVVGNGDNEGKCYRFAFVDEVYQWILVADADVTKALSDAAKAQASADGKATVFTGTAIPVGAQEGDLWMKSANDGIFTYVSGEWVEYNKYTTLAEEANEAASNAAATATEAKEAASNAETTAANAETNATAAHDAVQKTVNKVDLEYIVTDSPSIVPSQDDTRWKTEAPTRQEGKYIWSRQKMYFVNGNTEYSKAACITGDKGAAGQDGEDGKDGANGTDGVGITHIEVKYSVSLSSTEPPTDWKESIEQVEIQDGMFFWTRIETFYSDGSSTIAHSIAKQGQSGAVDAYLIDSNVEEINRFFNGEGNIYFSPEEINFKTWKDGLLLELEDYSYSLGIIYERETGDPSLDDLNNLFSSIDNSITKAYIINDNGEKENINLLDRILILSNNELSFKLSELLLCYLDRESSYFNDFVSLKQVISQQTSAFIFKVFKNELDKENDRFASYKVMECKFGTSEEMARFQITATKIQAAVDNARMTFAADGLTITDGKFVIQKTSEENTVKNLLDFSNGKLYIDGHGTFSGDGSFSGEIKAGSGNIGGFIIENNALYSSDKYKKENTFVFDETLTYYEKVDEEYIQTKDQYLSTEKEYYTLTGEDYSLVTTAQFLSGRVYFERDENGNYTEIPDNEKADLNKNYYYIDFSIALLGEDNKIIANNIELGIGAKILKHIELGEEEAYIYNPSEYNGLFLSTGGKKIQINAKEETLTLGDITLNGKASSISGTGFDIRPGFSSFDNIRVSGEITTSIFTKGSTQAVGGAMLFKIAYKIENQETSQISPQEEEVSQGIIFTLKEDILNIFTSDEDVRYVVLVAKDGSLSKYFEIKKGNFSENEGAGTVNITLDVASKTYNTLIVLGKNDDIVIGVNSENNKSALLEPKGLTISQLRVEETETDDELKLDTDLKVFLGDLTTLGLNGYGLYSNNVYLTGSLTTELSNGVYAGVNTLNGVDANKFGDDDRSNIVFWAGSQGTNDEAIKNAKFQVTQNGSIYASQGFFEDSVIARSRITGADIYTARLHGVKLNDDGVPTEGAGALTIYDTSAGIIFKTVSSEGAEIETFSISADGLKVSDQNFITINDNKATFTGIGFFDEVNPKIINFNDNNNNEIKNIAQLLQENGSFFIKHTDSNSSIKIENEISFSFDNIESKFVFSNSHFNANVATANFSGNIRLGDEESNIEYRKVENGKGYDLYVF